VTDRVQEVINRILGIWWKDTDPKMSDTRWFWDGKESYYYNMNTHTFGISSFTPEGMDGNDSYERTTDPREKK
jgi:hypothetical protein